MSSPQWAAAFGWLLPVERRLAVRAVTRRMAMRPTQPAPPVEEGYGAVAAAWFTTAALLWVTGAVVSAFSSGAPSDIVVDTLTALGWIAVAVSIGRWTQRRRALARSGRKPNKREPSAR